MPKIHPLRAAASLLLLAVVGPSCEGGEAAPPPPAAVCPDGLCNGEETSDTCPEDCAPAVQCGDGTCDQAGGECDGCAEDCPESVCETCGNGVCLASVESCATCAEDCGDCMACGEPIDAAPPDLTNAAICDFLDPAHCLFPFPSDHFLRADPTTATGKRVNLALGAMPKNAAGVPIRPDEFNRGDGWSPLSTLTLKVHGPTGQQVSLVESGAPGIYNMARSLEADSPILVIDAETGERVPVWAELDVQAASTAVQSLLIRPVRTYAPGRRYIVALRNLVDAQRTPLEAGPAFRTYRDCRVTEEPAIEARRGHMEGIFNALAKTGVKRSELYLAWDFTIASAESIAGRLLHMRDQSFAELGQQPIKTLLVKQTETPSDGSLQRIVTGKYLVPNYLNTPLPNSRLAYGPDGKPAKQQLPFEASFTCIIPKSATGSNPSRIALYGHQVLASQAEVQNSNVKKLAFEHNITFCATDWVGMSEDDTANIATFIADLSNFPSLTDRLHQAHLNFLFLGRLMKDANAGLSKDPNFLGEGGLPLLDPSELYYFGEGQGGTLGTATLAVAQDWTKAVFSVCGMGYSLLLPRSVDGKQFTDLFEKTYPNYLDLAVALQLMQMPWDSTESSGYAWHVSREPLPNSPPKQVLLHEAFGDHVVPNITSQILARSLETKLRIPPLAPGRNPDQSPYFGLESIPSYPHSGSAFFVWDAGAEPPDPDNEPTTKGLDPHGAPGATAAMRAVSAQFMGSGGITDVCNGSPCVTDL